MTSIAIMQPTFLPWLGYFALMDQVDHFVFLDDVQFAKQSWQSRNRIKGQDGAVMLSLSVARKPSKPLIRDAKLAQTGFETTLMAVLETCLARAPHYETVRGIVADGFAGADRSLSALNTGIIRQIAEVSGLTTPLYFSSDFPTPKQTTRSGRLLDICNIFGADRYVSPVGSYTYLTEERVFDASPIALKYLNFEHPTYPQLFGDFLPFMAAIDALAHVGPDNFLALLKSGIRPLYSPDDMKRIQLETL